MSSWPVGRARHGGIDVVPVPGVPGRMWLCGKHAVALDPEAVIAEVGEPAVVFCLTERFELAERYPAYVEWLRLHDGARARWFPIPDMHAPELVALQAMIAEIVEYLRAGRQVVIHCAAGIGRSGTVALGALMTLGMSRRVGAAHLAAHRPMAGPEVGPQHDLLAALQVALAEDA